MRKNPNKSPFANTTAVVCVISGPYTKPEQLRTLAFRSEACLEWEMLSRWKRVRYRVEWIGLLVAAKLIPRLSRKSCFHLAQMLGSLMSIFDRHGYRVALNNLEVALGDQFSTHERRKIARESFQHFARPVGD